LKHITFIHIPKTGGTSIRVAYSDLEDSVFWTGHESALLKYTRLQQALGKDEADRVWNNSFKFTFVRNPWARAVSHYKYMQKNGALSRVVTFEDWANMMFEPLHLKHRGRRSAFIREDKRPSTEQVAWFMDLNYEPMVDFVGKLENIEEDWSYVCDKIGLNIKLPHLNATPHKHYREYYTPKTRDMLADLAEVTIDLFGYKF
jgi:hypothetical protein